MGNKGSQPNYIKVNICLCSDTYYSGQTVKGVLYLSTEQNFVAETLHLRMEGRQGCEWFEGSSHNKVRHYDRRTFFKFDHPLQMFENNYVHKGDYAWPFMFTLPDRLPGSFKSTKHPNNYIQYQIGAFFVEYNIPSSLISYTKQFHLLETFKQALSPLQGTVSGSPLKWLCYQVGEIYLRCRLSSNKISNQQRKRMFYRGIRRVGYRS